MYSKLPEAQLLSLIKEGDRFAFDEVYNKHANSLYGAAYNVIRERDTCLDLLQDIFVWFWEHREQWVLTSCKGYLLTAVKFKTANYIRNYKFRNSFFQELAVVQINTDNVDADLETKQLLSLIKNVISQLPDRCREIFELSRYHQLTNKEIAAKLNVSEKTVENQITIAIRKLRGKLRNNYMLLFLLL